MGNNFSNTTVIGGTVHPEFESVRDMFKKNFLNGKEEDAQLCVYVDGKRVVDLWGSARGDETYNGDSLQCVFSSSKVITAIAIASIADRGLIKYSSPVARYIPEFAAHSKEHIKVEDLLRNESGLANLHTSIDPKDLLPEGLERGTVAKIVANSTVNHHEKSIREYHLCSAGWVLNEIVRRVTPDNITIGKFIKREFYDKYGVDVHCGLTEPELSRTRDLRALTRNTALLHSLLPNAFGAQVEHNIFVFNKLYSSVRRITTNAMNRGFAQMYTTVGFDMDPSEMFENFYNSDVTRQGESPHSNMHASARGLAKLAAAMANGGTLNGQQILTPNGWSLLHANPIIRGDALWSMARTELTQGGVNMYNDYDDDTRGERIMKSGRHGYIGWKGVGGSVIQWHPQLNLGFGYACTFITWWDFANSKARKLQKEVVVCTKRLKEGSDENNNDIKS